MPKERMYKGKSCRFYRDGSIWVSADGKVAGMSDKKGHIKNLAIMNDSKGKFVIHDWFGRVEIAMAVITCYCPPFPQDGNKYVINYKDGDPMNCDKSNLVWVPYHYKTVTYDKVTLRINGICYTVCHDGTIWRGTTKETIHDSQFDPDMGLECCLDKYLSVPNKNSCRNDKFFMDQIMAEAGYVLGDDAGLTIPVILHKDYDWANFSSDNLEWTEVTDQRYIDYQTQKRLDKRKRCEELNPGQVIPDWWI